MKSPSLSYAEHMWGERDGYVEIRAMDNGTVKAREWLKWPNDKEEFASAVEDELSDLDVFSGALLRESSGVGTAGDCEPFVNVLWADVDKKRGGYFSKLIRDMWLLPDPTMVVDSGNGWHVYWKLSKPVTQGAAEAYMRYVALELDGDMVGDPARILRVPGSFNHKTDPPHPVRIIHTDSALARPADFDAVYQVPINRSASAGGHATGTHGTRSEAIFKAVIGWVKDGKSDEDIYSALLSEPIGEKVQEMRTEKRRRDWVNLTISKARRAAKQ